MSFDSPSAQEAMMMETVAREAAERAVSAVRAELRAELAAETRRLEVTVKDALQEELALALGKGGAQAHLVQHDRIDRFLGFVDKVQDNFFGTIVKGIAKAIFALLLLGVAYYAGGQHNMPKIGG